MDQAWQEAALRGETALLHQRLREDPFALDRIQLGSLTHTPLHVSAFRGHLQFTIEIMNRCPSLVLALDSRRWSPLHLAAAQGHVEVAKVLAQAGPEMCGVVDGDGYNPLHLAAVKGRAGVLTELVRVGMYGARGKTAGGEGILHLCVKYGRVECLKVLVENVKDPEFTNGKDCDGNNVLHQAVKYKQIRIINYIISRNIKIDINATNTMGLTPLDILLQQNHHMNVKDFEIEDTLRQVGARKSDEILASIGLPFRRRRYMWILQVVMWVTITAMAFTCAYTLVALTPKKDRASLKRT